MKNYTREETWEMYNKMIDEANIDVGDALCRYFNSDEIGRALASIANDYDMNVDEYGIEIHE